MWNFENWLVGRECQKNKLQLQYSRSDLVNTSDFLFIISGSHFLLPNSSLIVIVDNLKLNLKRLVATKRSHILEESCVFLKIKEQLGKVILWWIAIDW